MPKKRQIPFLFSRNLANGRVNWVWNPSRRLRSAGFASVNLGNDERAALARALDLNDQVRAWEAGSAAQAADAPVRVPLPRVARFRDLKRAFMVSDEWRALRPSTVAEYRSRLHQLEIWAMDGDLPLRDLTVELVRDLKRVRMRMGVHNAAGVLRVLRLLLNWGNANGYSTGDLSRKFTIPEPPSRTRRLIRDDVDYLTAAAEHLGHHHVALAAVLGFYTMQREGDLLATTRFRMSPIRDISAEAHGALAGPDGRVLGLSLEQEKTRTPVSIPLTPLARVAVESALAGLATPHRAVISTYLISRGDDGARCPAWRFQRDFRAVVHQAVSMAARSAWQWHAAGDRDRAALAIDAGKRLRGIQFRDLRRSGMCWMRDLGVPVPLIASISGHSIEQTQKILDTYMPRDTRAAAEAMAMAVTRQAERDAKHERPGRQRAPGS